MYGGGVVGGIGVTVVIYVVIVGVASGVAVIIVAGGVDVAVGSVCLTSGIVGVFCRQCCYRRRCW